MSRSLVAKAAAISVGMAAVLATAMAMRAGAASPALPVPAARTRAAILLNASALPATHPSARAARPSVHASTGVRRAAASPVAVHTTTAKLVELQGDVAPLAPQYREVLSTLARDNYNKEPSVGFAKIARGNPAKKELALTFDDGPHRYYTLKLLDALRRSHAKATFFLVGKQVQKFPGLVQLEVMEGHEVGNHTYDHVDLTKIPPTKIAFELDHCDMAIEKATGAPTHLFRPPGGQYNQDVVREAAQRHYVTALWTIDPGDYAKPGADIILQRTLDRLENGSIILLHDGMPETVSILPTLIAAARERGFTFVTMSELLRDK